MGAICGIFNKFDTYRVLCVGLMNFAVYVRKLRKTCLRESCSFHGKFVVPVHAMRAYEGVGV
jgi:hypothetical protein